MKQTSWSNGLSVPVKWRAGLQVVLFGKVAVLYWQGDIDVSIRAALHSAAAW